MATSSDVVAEDAGYDARVAEDADAAAGHGDTPAAAEDAGNLPRPAAVHVQLEAGDNLNVHVRASDPQPHPHGVDSDSTPEAVGCACFAAENMKSIDLERGKSMRKEPPHKHDEGIRPKRTAPVTISGPQAGPTPGTCAPT